MGKRSILPGGCTGWRSEVPGLRLVLCEIQAEAKDGKYKVLVQPDGREGFLQSRKKYAVGDVVEAIFLKMTIWGKLICTERFYVK